MYPYERSLVQQLSDSPFKLLGVNNDSDLEELSDVIRKEKIDWRSFQNAEGKDGVISENWAVYSWPSLYLIDAEGVVRWHGEHTQLDKQIEQLLAEIGHGVRISRDNLSNVKNEK